MVRSIDMRNALIDLAVAVVLALAFCAVLDMSGLPLTSQTTFDSQLDLRPGHEAGQSFVGEAAGLYRVDLLVARSGPASCPLLFHLRAEQGTGDDLVTVELNASLLQDTSSPVRRPNAYQSFIFNSVESSRGKRLYFSLESADSTSECPVILNFQSQNVYVEGTRYVDGVKDCGDLAFKAYYKGSPLATGTLLLSRLTEGKPVPLSQPACYVIALFAYLLVFARLVHVASALWFKSRNDNR